LNESRLTPVETTNKGSQVKTALCGQHLRTPSRGKTSKRLVFHEEAEAVPTESVSAVVKVSQAIIKLRI